MVVMSILSTSMEVLAQHWQPARPPSFSHQLATQQMLRQATIARSAIMNVYLKRNTVEMLI